MKNIVKAKVLFGMLLVGMTVASIISGQNDKNSPPRFAVIPISTSLGDAWFINEGGEIIGQSSSDAGAVRVIVVKNGKQERVLHPCHPAHGIHLPFGGISNAGVVSANCHKSHGSTSDTTRACIWQRNGKCQELGALGGKYSQSFGINSWGQVVGQAETGKIRLEQSGANPKTVAVQHAFLWDGKQMEDLDKENPGSSAAEAINDNGDIIIARYSPSRDSRGDRSRYFMRSNGQMEEIHGINDRDHYIRRMNRQKQVLVVTGPNSSAIWEAGKMTTLQGLWNPSGSDLNDKGQVVGVADSSIRWNEWLMPTKIAFLWQGGTMYDLNDLIPKDSGLVLIHALGINNKSQIVGIARREKDGETLAFLLNPL